MNWRLGAGALLTAALAGCGGTEIQGIVREEGTGQPLPGATVRIGDEVTRTGPGGFYELEVDIDEDEPARVQIGASGYEPKSSLVSVPEDLDTVYSDFELTKEKTEQQRQEEARMLERQHQQDQRYQQDQRFEGRQQEQEFKDAQRQVEDAERKLEEAERRIQRTEERLNQQEMQRQQQMQRQPQQPQQQPQQQLPEMQESQEPIGQPDESLPREGE